MERSCSGRGGCIEGWTNAPWGPPWRREHRFRDSATRNSSNWEEDVGAIRDGEFHRMAWLAAPREGRATRVLRSTDGRTVAGGLGRTKEPFGE